MRRTLKVATIAVAVLLLAGIALSFLIDANRFRPALESRLSQALGRPVKFGNLKVSIFSGGVTADDLFIADDPAFSRAPFIQAKSLHVGVNMSALVFSRTLSVTSLTIEQPQIQLLQSPAGDWNFSSLGAKTATQSPPSEQTDNDHLALTVQLLKISSGKLAVGRTEARSQPLQLEKVDIELRDFDAMRSFPFSASMAVVGGGTIKLDGTAGPLDPNDIAMTPANLKLQVSKLDLVRSKLNEIAPELAGLVTFDGSGRNGTNGVELTGKLKIEKLKLSAKGSAATRPVELDFHISHDLKKRTGRVHQGDIHFGSAITRLTGTYTPQGDSFLVNMTVDGPPMPVQELVGLLPALGVTLPNGTSLRGGTAAVKATIQGPIDRLVIAGSMDVNSTRLTGFNLSSKLGGVERLAGIKAGNDTEIQQLSGNVRVAPEGITTQDLKLIVPAIGDVTGAGTIDPNNALDFKMRAAVHTSGFAAALNDAPVPFTITGTCADPVFRPDVGAVVKDEMKGVGKAAGSILKGLLGDKDKK